MKLLRINLFLLLVGSFCLTAQENKEDETYHQKLEAWKNQKAEIERQNQEKLNAKVAKEKFNAGNSWYRQANYSAAVKAFQEAIALDAHFQKAYVNLGLSYKQLGDYSNALISYDSAMTLMHGDKDVAMKTAEYKIRLLMDTHGYEKAIRTITVYLQEYPVNAHVLYDLMYCHNATGDYRTALDVGKQGLKISNDEETTAALNFELGEACKKSGSLSEAAVYYRNSMVSEKWKELAEYQLKDLEMK